MSDRVRSHRHGPPSFAPNIGLREVLEGSPDVVFSTDAWGRLVWAAQTFESFTGRRIKDCVGSSVAVLLAPGHAHEARRAFVQLCRNPGETRDLAVELVKPDGRTVPMDLRLRMAETASGERYLFGLARARAEATGPPVLTLVPGRASDAKVVELETSLAEARQVAQVKGDFLATMSHEMRTPMSGMLSMTNMLLQGELHPDQRQIVELIRESTQTLLTLLSDTLDYSRLEAGRMPVDCLDFDLRVTVDQIAGILHPLAMGKGLTFESRVHALAPSRLKGDPGRVRQVLMTLGANAIRCTEHGGVAVRV